jgi:DNA-binding transcriptional ArsR family regulator
VRKIHHPTTIDLSSVLYALSDPVRLCIVKTLASKKELCCKQFKSPVKKSTMSHHFKALRDAGITRTRVVGTRHITSLCRKELQKNFPGLLDAVLKAAKY